MIEEVGKEGGEGRSGVEKLWEELSLLEPDEVSARTLAERGKDGFRLFYMGDLYRIQLGDRVIFREGEGGAEHPAGPCADPRDDRPRFLMSLLFYLIHAKEIPASGNWISPKDLPGGSLFFRGQHAIFTTALEKKYGTAPEKFLEMGESLGGKQIQTGDAGVEIPVFPRITYGLVLWKGDEEYPARINPLVDSRIALHYPEPIPLDALLMSLQEFLCRLAGE